MLPLDLVTLYASCLVHFGVLSFVFLSFCSSCLFCILSLDILQLTFEVSDLILEESLRLVVGLLLFLKISDRFLYRAALLVGLRLVD